MSEPQSTNHLLTVAGEVELERRLAQCERVSRFDDSERESAAIANSLGDLEKVFRRYLDHLLPRVLEAKTCDALETALSDIHGEFHELVWHLWYPKSFRNVLLGQDAHPPSIDTRLRP
jgi:hypothetical protein